METKKIFERKRKMRILTNSAISHSAKILKWETFGLFDTSVSAKYQKTCKGDPLKAKKIEKQSHSAEKQLKEGTLQSGPLAQMLENVSG